MIAEQIFSQVKCGKSIGLKLTCVSSRKSFNSNPSTTSSDNINESNYSNRYSTEPATASGSVTNNYKCVSSLIAFVFSGNVQSFLQVMAKKFVVY